MRWFLNKFPAVEKKGSPKIRAKKFLCESDGYGVHEVIVETNHHKSQLWDIPAEYIKEWLEVIKFRMEKFIRLMLPLPNMPIPLWDLLLLLRLLMKQ